MKVLVPHDQQSPTAADASNTFFPFNPSLDDEIKRLFANFTVTNNVFARRNGK